MEFPSNSHESRLVGNTTPQTDGEETVKKVDPVVTNARVRKTPLHNRLMRSLGGADGHTVIDHIVNRILIPAAKDLLIKAVDDLAQGSKVRVRQALGDNSPLARSRSPIVGNSPLSSNRPTTRISYDGYSRNRPAPREDDRREKPRRPAPRSRYHEPNDYLMDSMVKAMEVLEVLRDLIRQFGVVTVSDFKEALDYEPTHTDVEWGWVDLSSPDIRPMRHRDGYYNLNLPVPDYLGDDER